jgi:imidazolonepropionase-like amidohydrolase
MIKINNFTRRELIKFSLNATSILLLSEITGCRSVVFKNVPEINYTKGLLLQNCNLVDVINGKIRKDVSIFIKDGAIKSISNKNDIPIQSTQIIDVGHKYIIPGLIDAHCHSTMAPVFSMRIFDLLKYTKQIRLNYNLCIESGVTTIRDTGAFPGLLKVLLRDIKNKTMNGPRIYYCNSILNIKGGHPDIPLEDVYIFAESTSRLMGSMMLNFKNLKDLKKDLANNANNASFIKLTVDNKSIFCRKEDIPVYMEDHLNLIFKYADENHLPVSAHCMRKWGFDRITRYPINSLEHIVGDKMLKDEEILKFSKKNIAIVPTMTVGLSYLMEESFDELPVEFRNNFIENELKIRRNYLNETANKHCLPDLHNKNLKALNDYKLLGKDNLWNKHKFLVDPDLFFGTIINGSENLKKMKSAGVLIGCGIDAGMPLCYFGGLYRELEFLSRIGFKNEDILRSATINNAKIIKADDKIGSVNEGKYADLVILEENPFEKIEACRKILAVLKEGEIVYALNALTLNNKRVICI